MRGYKLLHRLEIFWFMTSHACVSQETAYANPGFWKLCFQRRHPRTNYPQESWTEQRIY